MEKINIEKYEINKPSELTQVVYYDNYDKGIISKINAIQLDLLNALMYQAKKNIIINKIDISEEKIVDVEISLQEIMKMLGKYEKGQYKYAMEQLYKLKKLDVMINTLGKVKDTIEFELTSFIHTLKWTRHKNTTLKKIKVGLDGTILNSFLNRKKLFSKMFLSIQYSMSSKYSKLLYEILKDYEGIRNIIIKFDILLELLNVDTHSTDCGKWNIFRPSILEKSIREINTHSDIFVGYEPIKEKLPGQRKQVTKIKFNITKQSESRLQELGLIEEPITSLPFYNKSKAKLNNLVKNGYKVIDEDMWIQTDIKKNEDRYDAEVRIDKWLKETDQEERNDIYRILAENLDNCEDPMIVIEDYKLIGLFSKDAFTKNPSETIEKLNWIIEALNVSNQN